MATKTTIEMAREAAGDDWGLFQEYMPEIHRFAELVRADERNSWPAEQPAQQEPVAFLDWYDNAHWGNEDFKHGCWRAWDAALAQQPAQRKPLTKKQIKDALADVSKLALPFGDLVETIARAIEAAHNIKENT